MSENDLIVWGDEDGDRWFADGAHLSLEEMAREVERFEVEVTSEEDFAERRAEVETGRVTHLLVVEDYRDEERFVVFRNDWRGRCAQLFLDARPLTELLAGSGIDEDPNQAELFQ